MNCIAWTKDLDSLDSPFPTKMKRFLTGCSQPHYPSVLVTLLALVQAAGLTSRVRLEPDVALWPQVLSPTGSSQKALGLS